jgi:hypothetical protein
VVVLGDHEHEAVEPPDDVGPGAGVRVAVVANRRGYRFVQEREALRGDVDDLDVDGGHVRARHGRDPFGHLVATATGPGRADHDPDAQLLHESSHTAKVQRPLY